MIYVIVWIFIPWQTREMCQGISREISREITHRASKELSWSTCSQMRKKREIKSDKCDESKGGLSRNDKQWTENVLGFFNPENIDTIMGLLFF